MALDPRIALGVQPLQVQSPMQGAQQALTLRELMAGAAAREAQRDHYRMAQAQAVQQQQAAEAFRAGLAQSGGQMTPELASMGMRAGLSPTDLQGFAGMQDWGRPKVNQFVETVGPDGRPVKVGVDAYGRPMGEGFAQPVQLRDRDLGGEVVSVNPYTGQEAGPRVRKTPEQTELERLMTAQGIQPGSPQWNRVIGDYLMKKTTHAPAATTNVYTGRMLPAETTGGEQVFVMPSKDGTATVVPGLRPPGTAETAQKRERKVDSLIKTAEIVTTTVDSALKKVGRLTTGAGGAALGMLPGTDAYDLRAEIDTLKANLGFDTLQAMRDASPTGGALGQVAVQELTMLQSTVASLDPNQSPEQLRRNLESVRDRYQRVIDIIQGKEPASSGASGASGVWSIQRVE